MSSSQRPSLNVSEGIVNLASEQTKSAEEEASDRPFSENNVVSLKPRIGLWTGISIIIGSIIGTGIFISPKGVLRSTQSIGASLVCWIIGGVISLLGALTFAEMGILMPLSGGEYVYSIEAFKRFKCKLANLPAFLYIWMSIGLWHPIFLTVFAKVFSKYLIALAFIGCHEVEDNFDDNNFRVNLVSALVIMIVTFINCWSVKLTTYLLNIFGLMKFCSLILIIILGVVQVSRGHLEHFANSFEGTSSNAGDWSAAVISSLFAYSGWSHLNYVVEEIKDPERNLPRCILISLFIVTIVYLLTNVSYFTALSAAELLATDVVAVDFTSKVVLELAWLLPILVACSAFGSANGNSFAAARISYAAGKQGHMWSVMAYASVTRRTLMPGVLLNGVLALFYLPLENIDLMIQSAVVLQYIFYIITVIALLLLKREWVTEKPKFRLHIGIPVSFLVVCFIVVLTTIIGTLSIAYLYSTAYTVVGILVYMLFHYYNVRVPYKDRIIKLIQLTLYCCPTKEVSLNN